MEQPEPDWPEVEDLALADQPPDALPAADIKRLKQAGTEVFRFLTGKEEGSSSSSSSMRHTSLAMHGPPALEYARSQGRPAEIDDFVMEDSTFIDLNLLRHWGPDLAEAAAAAASGSAPPPSSGSRRRQQGQDWRTVRCICPKCNKWSLQYKNAVYENVIVTGTLDGWCFTLPHRLECPGCPGAHGDVAA